MKTYLFVEKNGSGVLTLTALDEDAAEIYLASIVTEPNAWRLEDSEDDEDFQELIDNEFDDEDDD